jgi:hypothetical protein
MEFQPTDAGAHTNYLIVDFFKNIGRVARKRLRIIHARSNASTRSFTRNFAVYIQGFSYGQKPVKRSALLARQRLFS